MKAIKLEKFLKKTWETLCAHELGNNFSPKTWYKKLVRWTLSKFKTLTLWKTVLRRYKGRDWEKTFVNPMTRLVSRIFKEMLQLSITKATQFKNGQRSE